jgi:hypothetical protein
MNKVVHFNLYRPEKSIFKANKNTKSEIQIITCNNSDNCQLFKRQECACRYGLYGNFCYYGKQIRISGYTRSAKKYSTWCNEQKKKYEGVQYLNEPKMMGIVGDFIFLPYPFIKKYKKLIEYNFIELSKFTVDNVIDIINFIPRDLLFNDEIKRYQDEVIPTFLNHLKDQMPELFNQVISKNDAIKARCAKLTNIGRKAILETITPNKGYLIDIHGCEWIWDGEKLTSNNSKASFMIVPKFEQIILIPKPNQGVIIRDESQVNENTIFID